MTALEASEIAAPAAPISRIAAWGAVFILFILAALSLFDRQVVSVLIGDIKHDLHLGDFTVSLATSLSFGVFYVLFSFPLGWLIDRLPRRPMLWAGVTIWSIMTMAGGVTRGFAALFVSRSLTGAGEAVVLPGSVAVIGDAFARDRVAFPLSLFTLSNAFGSAAALMGGGALLDWAIHRGGASLPVVGHIEPWRLVMVMVGAPGLLLAFLVFLLPRHKPRPVRAAGGDPARAIRFGAFVRSRGLLMTCHILGYALTSLTLIMMSFWTPQHMVRMFHWSNTRLGLTLGVVTLSAALISSPLTGLLSDWLYRRGVIDAPLRVFRYMLSAALPIAAFAYLIPSAPIFLVCYFLLTALIAANHLSNTTIQLVTPPDLRGRYVGSWSSVSGFVSSVIGPPLVGFLTQFVFRNDAKLGLAITIVLVACVATALGLVTLALPAMRRAVVLLAEEAEAAV